MKRGDEVTEELETIDYVKTLDYVSDISGCF